MLFKSAPTTSEKIKDTARAVADQAAQKAAEAKTKAEKDIMPVITEKADEARVIIAEKAEETREAAKPHLEKVADAAQPHLEKVAEATAEQREAAEKKLAEVRAAAEKKLEEAADAAEQARKDADKKGRKLGKRANKKAGKAQKKADKKKDALLVIAAAKAAQAEKKATKTFGPQTREDVSYTDAALRGCAEDKHLTADDARDYYKNEVLPHLKELLAVAATAGTAASHNVVGQLPDGAQKQAAQYAPALAPKKKGGFLMFVGAGALAGAVYLVYADQQKKRSGDAKLSQDAIADSRAPRQDSMTINNPVTNFEKADDTTMVRPGVVRETAEPASGPGTASTWVDAESTGHMSTKGLEDPAVIEETRSSRRASREDQ